VLDHVGTRGGIVGYVELGLCGPAARLPDLPWLREASNLLAILFYHPGLIDRNIIDTVGGDDGVIGSRDNYTTWIDGFRAGGRRSDLKHAQGTRN